MSSEEQKRVLKMVEDGKISAEEAMTLMQALEESAEPQVEVLETGAGQESGLNDDPALGDVAEQAHKYWQILVGIGVAITVLGAGAMYWAMQDSGYGFWFYCAWLPFLLGVLLMGIGAGSHSARWLYVRIEQDEDWPGKIVFGMPLPLGLAAWTLRTFGRWIPDLEHVNVDEILQILEQTTSADGPLVVNVHDDEDGERVQVFIG
jgi:hypothetical protein